MIQMVTLISNTCFDKQILQNIATLEVVPPTPRESKFYFSFRHETRASVSHWTPIIPMWLRIVTFFHSVYLTQITLVHNQLFPPFLGDSDDSITIIMILASICDNSMRNAAILPEKDTNSSEMCQFFLSSLYQLQKVTQKNFLQKSSFLIALTLLSMLLLLWNQNEHSESISN